MDNQTIAQVDMDGRRGPCVIYADDRAFEATVGVSKNPSYIPCMLNDRRCRKGDQGRENDKDGNGRGRIHCARIKLIQKCVERNPQKKPASEESLEKNTYQEHESKWVGLDYLHTRSAGSCNRTTSGLTSGPPESSRRSPGLFGAIQEREADTLLQGVGMWLR